MKIHEYQAKLILKKYNIPIQDGLVVDNKEDINQTIEDVQKTFNSKDLAVINHQFYGYDHYPLIAVNEMRKMVDKVKLNVPKVSSPVLLIHSKIDKTALFENYFIIKKLLKKTQLSTLILEETGHNVFDTEESDKEQIFSTISTFTQNILNE